MQKRMVSLMSSGMVFASLRLLEFRFHIHDTKYADLIFYLLFFFLVPLFYFLKAGPTRVFARRGSCMFPIVLYYLHSL